MKLDGFGIFVKDMPTMVRFYRDVLGFEIKEEENTTNVYLMKDGTLFLLYRRTDFEQMTESKFNYAHGTNGHFEIALSVDNYAAVDKAYNDAISKRGYFCNETKYRAMGATYMLYIRPRR